MKISNIQHSQRAKDLLTRDVTVDFGEDEDGSPQELNLKVRVTGISDGTRAAITRLQAGVYVPEVDEDATDEEREAAEAEAQAVLDDLTGSIARVLGELIAEWDGTDDDGNPLLPTRKVFAELDPVILFALMAAVGEALATDPKGNSKSSKGSTSARKPASRRRKS